MNFEKIILHMKEYDPETLSKIIKELGLVENEE